MWKSGGYFFWLLQMRTTISIIVAISNRRVNTSSVLILLTSLAGGRFDRLRCGADTLDIIPLKQTLVNTKHALLRYAGGRYLTSYL